MKNLDFDELSVEPRFGGGGADKDQYGIEQMDAAFHFEKLREFGLTLREVADRPWERMNIGPLHEAATRTCAEMAAQSGGSRLDDLHLFDVSPEISSFVQDEAASQIAEQLIADNVILSMEDAPWPDGQRKIASPHCYISVSLPVPEMARLPFERTLFAGVLYEVPGMALVTRNVAQEFGSDNLPSAFGVYRTPTAFDPTQEPKYFWTSNLLGSFMPGAQTFLLFPDVETRPQFQKLLKDMFAGRNLTMSDLVGSLSELQQVGAPQPVCDLVEEILLDIKLMYRFILTVTVLNEPAITTTQPSTTRQQRRQLERSTGLPAERMRKVVWNLTREAVAQQDQKTGRPGVALHVRRGHWRRCKCHYKGAVLRDGDWFQWIEQTYVGHPAYGVVRREGYAPQIGSGEL